MPDVLIQLLMVPYFSLKSAVWMTNYIVAIIMMLVYMSALEYLTVRHEFIILTTACF